MFGKKGRWAVWFGLGLGLLAPRSGLAQTNYDAGNEHYEQAHLNNGLDVYVAEDHRVPLVALCITYPVGSTLDPAGARGAAAVVAQLLPHLGSHHLPSGAADLIEAAGFYPWHVSAVARDDDTRVELLVPAGAIDLALFLLAERTGFADDGLFTPMIEEAKSKVAQSFVTRSGATDSNVLGSQLTFDAAHPYAALGSEPQLGKLDIDWLKQRLRRFYSAAGAKLSIVGDVDAHRLMPVVQKTFGMLKGLPAPTVSAPSIKPSATPRLGEVRSADVNSGFYWMWATPRYLTEDDIALDVAARYLSHRLSTRLATNEKRARVWARQASRDLVSVFELYLPVPDGTERAQAEHTAREELDAIATGKIDATELELAKSTIIREMASDMDDLQSRARFLTSYATLSTKLEGFGPHLKSYASVDAARLADVVHRNLARPAAVITLTHDERATTPTVSGTPQATFVAPNAADAPALPDAAEWYRPPAAVPVPRFDPPRIFEANVGKSRLLFMPRAGLPTTRLRIGLNWQGAAPLPDVRILLLNNLLRAKSNGGPALRDRLTDLGAVLTSEADEDTLGLGVTVVPERADAAMSALRDALEVERFDATTFASVRDDAVKAFDKATADDWELSSRWFQKVARPKSNRFHYDVIGNAARGAALRQYDQHQLEAFWKAERRADHLTVSIVGPVDEARARGLAELGLPRFQAGKSSKLASPPPTPGVFLVDAPKSEDLRLQFSWTVPAWGSAGYVDSLGLRWLFAEYWAGGLSKYLHDNGVKTTNDWFSNTLTARNEARVVFAVRVPKAEVAGVFKAIPQFVTSLQHDAIPWEQVQEARREAVQWVTTRFEGAKGCMSLLSAQADNDTPATTGDDLYLFAQRIDRASLNKAAAALSPEKATVVVYGPVTELAEPLKHSGFGTVTVVSADTDGGAP